jgi:hypothetical protein
MPFPTQIVGLWTTSAASYLKDITLQPDTLSSGSRLSLKHYSNAHSLIVVAPSSAREAWLRIIQSSHPIPNGFPLVT